MEHALGLIETKGLVGAIEAADAMVKAADVKIISKEKVTGGLIIIKVMGETAAVKASVDAGSVAAQRVGELVGVHVIPRPDDQIDVLLFDKKIGKKKTEIVSKRVITPSPTKPKPKAQESTHEITGEKKVGKKEKVERTNKNEMVHEKEMIKVSSSKKKIPSMDQLVILNVHALRRIARGIDEFPIKGREISKAKRANLLDIFKNLQ